MTNDRKCGLTTLELARLEHACNIVVKGFGDAPYLVGSAGEFSEYRDVDVRLIMSDDEFDQMFGGERGILGPCLSGYWVLPCDRLGSADCLSDSATNGS